MHLPIKVSGEVFGIFSVCFSEPHAFGRDEVRLVARAPEIDTRTATRTVILEIQKLVGRGKALAHHEGETWMVRPLDSGVTTV